MATTGGLTTYRAAWMKMGIDRMRQWSVISVAQCGCWDFFWVRAYHHTPPPPMIVHKSTAKRSHSIHLWLTASLSKSE